MKALNKVQSRKLAEIQKFLSYLKESGQGAAYLGDNNVTYGWSLHNIYFNASGLKIVTTEPGKQGKQVESIENTEINGIYRAMMKGEEYFKPFLIEQPINPEHTEKQPEQEPEQEEREKGVTIDKEINTEAKRLTIVTALIDYNFRRVGEVTFHEFKRYDLTGREPSCYWIYTFKTPSIEKSYKLNTATLSNEGYCDFNTHTENIKNLKY
jgi:hypothetical protein